MKHSRFDRRKLGFAIIFDKIERPYKELFSIFVVIIISISIKAQKIKLSPEEEEKCKQSLCTAVLINSQGAGVYTTGISPEYMKILSFSFSPSGKIARVKGHYASAPKDSWIELFYQEDLAYAIVYSQNPKNIITPYVVAPSGAMQPYKGPQLNEIKTLQQTLAKTLQVEREQEQLEAKRKEKEENSGEQRYDPGKNGVSAEMFAFVKKCLDEYFSHSDYRLISNTLTVKVIKALNNHQMIRGSFMTKTLFVDGYIPQWVNILFEDGLAYFMDFYTGKLGEFEPSKTPRHLKRYYTPLATLKKNESVYSGSDITKIRMLQAKFLHQREIDDAEFYKVRYMEVIKQQLAMKNKEIGSLSCFVKGSKEERVIVGSKQNTLLKYDERGDPYEVPYGGTTPVYGTEIVSILKNTCQTSITVYGIEKYANEGEDIKYRNSTFRVDPGKSTNFKVISQGGYDDSKAELGETYYYLKPQVVETIYPPTAQEKEKSPKPIGTSYFLIESENIYNTVPIMKGDIVTINAFGKIKLGNFVGYGGPEGIDGYTSYNKIAAFRHGALLVRIGDNGSWEAVGTESKIIAKSSGQLQFMVNDNDASNNSGSFNIGISILKK